MGTIASQITSLTIVYSIVYSDADQRKHQSSASLAFVRWIPPGPVNSPHKWPVPRKMFPFDDVIMLEYISRTFFHHNFNSLEISFGFHPSRSKMIPSKVFHRIRITMETSSVKWAQEHVRSTADNTEVVTMPNTNDPSQMTFGMGISKASFVWNFYEFGNHLLFHLKRIHIRGSWQVSNINEVVKRWIVSGWCNILDWYQAWGFI